jgi:hypothetical protein
MPEPGYPQHIQAGAYSAPPLIVNSLLSREAHHEMHGFCAGYGLAPGRVSPPAAGKLWMKVCENSFVSTR